MENFNLSGFLTGLFSFLVTGLFHPVVIKLEYHFSYKVRWVLFIPGFLLIILSLFLQKDMLSVFSGVSGFAMIWSSHEMKEQHKRVILRGLPRKQR